MALPILGSAYLEKLDLLIPNKKKKEREYEN
jgi:hypothetical protein